MLQIANPIYDAVFKYLIEDGKVAQILLSCLLQREVTDVVVNPHEYSNTNKDKKVSVFRVDFAANIREKNGTQRRVHIEVQKEWVETEVQRFRQYIGTQYSNPANILHDDARSKDYGIPMVFIYLLGHCIGNIEEPVLYVKHLSFDYKDKIVTEDMPEPFIESLVHDCIFVQLPRLKMQKREGRLFEILDIFDQKYKDEENDQLLTIDESLYEGDKEMERIVRRLLMAASDVNVRQDMNIESEIFLALDRRDDTIEKQEEEIYRLGLQLAEKDKALAAYAVTLLKQEVTIEQVAQMTTLSVDYLEKLYVKLSE